MFGKVTPSTATSAEGDGVAVDGDLLLAERGGGGAGDDGAVGDREGAAVALAVDAAVGDRADDAPLVRAHGREALELAVRRLRDDHLVLGEDRAAADLDVGGLSEGVGPAGRLARGLAGARLRRPRGRRRAAR